MPTRNDSSTRPTPRAARAPATTPTAPLDQVPPEAWNWFQRTAAAVTPGIAAAERQARPAARGAERRHQAHQQRGDHRQPDGEKRHPRVQTNLIQPRQPGRCEARGQPQQSDRQRQAEAGSEGGQQRALRQQPAHQTPAPCPQGGAHRHLPPARRGAHQEAVREHHHRCRPRPGPLPPRTRLQLQVRRPERGRSRRWPDPRSPAPATSSPPPWLRNRATRGPSHRQPSAALSTRFTAAEYRSQVDTSR